MTKPLLLMLLLVASLSPAQTKRTITGKITDSMCAAADHSRMRMGANDAECTIACVDSHGSAFVLYDGKEVFGLSDQKTPEKLAGKRVTVTGAVNPSTMMIQVDSIVEAR